MISYFIVFPQLITYYDSANLADLIWLGGAISSRLDIYDFFNAISRHDVMVASYALLEAEAQQKRPHIGESYVSI
jgi:hypothetical protein